VAHELTYVQGVINPAKRPKEIPRDYWACTCTRKEGPGWVCYITLARPKGGTGGKPDRQEAERLHRRHIEDVNISEEAWW
jgi:hypothetical protein